jgi:UDP-glucose:(heptosyl)LPS alpha-1,3-glucosyltransferase
VVYNGVDVTRFSPLRRDEFRQSMRRQLGIQDDTVLAVAVAHNFHLKGVPTLLKALELLAPKRLPIHAVVVGGKHYKRWQHRARSKGLPITFVGARSDPVPFYAAADMHVHPSFYDSCSLVLLEAAASGLPLLVSRENGAAELLTDGVDALLLDDPANAELLAEKMRHLLDAALRERMGAAARRLAVRHNRQRNCDEILSIYRGTAKTPHGWYIKDLVRPAQPLPQEGDGRMPEIDRSAKVVNWKHVSAQPQIQSFCQDRIDETIDDEAKIASRQDSIY